MNKLSKTQIAILVAAGHDAGAPIPVDQHAAMTPLVRKGFLIIVPKPDGDRAIITDAGRAQLPQPEATEAGDQGDAATVPESVAAADDSAPKAAPSTQGRAAGGKIATMLELLRRPDGARIEELTAATGWQQHSVRGAIAGAIKKKRGIAVTSEKVEGVRIYRTEAVA